MRRYRRSMRRRRRSMWRRLCLWQRRRRYRRSMRRRRRSMRRPRRCDVGDRAELLYRRGVSGDIGDCGVGITPQMCNRVTNHGETVVIRCDDISARCGDVGARCGDVGVWGSDVGDRARGGGHSMRRYLRSMRRRRRSRGVTGDIGAEFTAISAIAELV